MASEIHRLGAHAMATEFQIFITATSEAKALTAASTALRDLETLESELSRFKGNSDIHRINHLPKGQSTPVGHAAIDCIELARDIHHKTNGAFDITLGPLLAIFTNPDKSPREPSEKEIKKATSSIGMDKLKTDVNSLTASVNSEDLWIDLGGIGKGYTLDQMALSLKESGITNAMLDAGSSTLLAFGQGPEGDGWPASLGLPNSPIINLENNALSGSGFSAQGEHIIDPRKHCRVCIEKINAWAIAPYAALSDALSTAFLVMTENEIINFCSSNTGVEAVLPDESKNI